MTSEVTPASTSTLEGLSLPLGDEVSSERSVERKRAARGFVPSSHDRSAVSNDVRDVLAIQPGTSSPGLENRWRGLPSGVSSDPAQRLRTSCTGSSRRRSSGSEQHSPAQPSRTIQTRPPQTASAPSSAQRPEPRSPRTCGGQTAHLPCAYCRRLHRQSSLPLRPRGFWRRPHGRLTVSERRRPHLLSTNHV